MTLPRTVADVLSEHVVFEVECIDRMYLNVYVPQLQYATGLVSYIHRRLGMPVASTAALRHHLDSKIVMTRPAGFHPSPASHVRMLS